MTYNSDIYLLYIGDGAALHGVPARHLTQAEVNQYVISDLIGSGLYKFVEVPKPAAPKLKKTDGEKGD